MQAIETLGILAAGMRRVTRPALSAALAVVLAFGAPAVCVAAADQEGAAEQQPAEQAGETDGDVSEPAGSDESAPVADAGSAKSKKEASKKAKRVKAATRSARADKIAARIAKQAVELETATEQLGALSEQLADAQKQVAKAEKKIKRTKEALASARANVAASAKEIYMNGQTRLLSVLLGATSFEDFASRLYLYEALTSDWIYTFRSSEELEKRLEAERADVAAKRADIAVLNGQVQVQGDAIAAQVEEQLETLSKLDKKLVKAVNRKVDGYLSRYSSAAERANTAARAWDAGTDGASTSTAGSHPKAVDIAMRCLGVKYVWGGEGMSGFDCSGLVKYCYGKIGVKLTHYARTQYDEGVHVAKSALMPGDLVFFGPNVAGIHHVGIYIGNDRFVHAPHTGDVVKISKLSSRGDCVGACRPK